MLGPKIDGVNGPYSLYYYCKDDPNKGTCGFFGGVEGYVVKSCVGILHFHLLLNQFCYNQLREVGSCVLTWMHM
jgi:hypothetical protein